MQVPRKDGVPRSTYRKAFPWSRMTTNYFGRRCVGLAWHIVLAWYTFGHVVGDRILSERFAQLLAASLATVKEGEGALRGRGLQDGESLGIATNFSLVLSGNTESQVARRWRELSQEPAHGPRSTCPWSKQREETIVQLPRAVPKRWTPESPPSPGIPGLLRSAAIRRFDLSGSALFQCEGMRSFCTGIGSRSVAEEQDCWAQGEAGATAMERGAAARVFPRPGWRHLHVRVIACMREVRGQKGGGRESSGGRPRTACRRGEPQSRGVLRGGHGRRRARRGPRGHHPVLPAEGGPRELDQVLAGRVSLGQQYKLYKLPSPRTSWTR